MHLQKLNRYTINILFFLKLCKDDENEFKDNKQLLTKKCCKHIQHTSLVKIQQLFLQKTVS